MNKPQAEERVNSRLYWIMQKKKVQHSSAIKKNIEAQLYFFLINMVELDHQRSAANTLVNKIYLFVFFNIFNYCRFASYSEFAFHCLNKF